MMKKVLAGSIMLAMASAANAATYTETKSFGTQGSSTDVGIGTLNQTITIDGFNNLVAANLIPAGSTLTGVTVTAYGQIDSSVNATSDPNNGSDATFTVDLYLLQNYVVSTSAGTFSDSGVLVNPNDFPPPGPALWHDEQSNVAPGDTWVTAFSTGEQSEVLTPASLSDFLNTVDFNFTTLASTSFQANFDGGIGQVIQQVSTAAWGAVEVVYTYEEAPPPGNVPEPGVLALLGLGLAGFGFGRARKRA